MQPFPATFVRKQKKQNKKSTRGSVVADAVPVWEVEVDTFRSLGSHLSLQPKHFKPPSWMYLFENSIFKIWQFSVIK